MTPEKGKETNIPKCSHDWIITDEIPSISKEWIIKPNGGREEIYYNIYKCTKCGITKRMSDEEFKKVHNNMN